MKKKKGGRGSAGECEGVRRFLFFHFFFHFPFCFGARASGTGPAPPHTRTRNAPPMATPLPPEAVAVLAAAATAAREQGGGGNNNTDAANAAAAHLLLTPPLLAFLSAGLVGGPGRLPAVLDALEAACPLTLGRTGETARASAPQSSTSIVPSGRSAMICRRRA